MDTGIPDVIGLHAVQPDAAVVKVMSIPDNRCIRVVIPDDNVGTDGFHEVLIHDMADADTHYVPVSDLGCLQLDLDTGIPDVIGLHAVQPDAAVVKVMSIPDNRCIRVVIPDDNVGTDGFHEVLIHDMADADTHYVPVSDLGCLQLDWPKALFSYMGCYQVDLEHLRH